MKNLIQLSVVLLATMLVIVVMGGCSKKETTEPPDDNNNVNQRPNTPTNLSPPDGSINQPVTTVLEWTCSVFDVKQRKVQTPEKKFDRYGDNILNHYQHYNYYDK